MVLLQYGERPMKTTIELPDELYRKAKATAALNGRKLKDLVEEGLRRILETPRKKERQRSLAALMAGARGAIDSGLRDLGSNPRHLKGFGRNAGDR
jgi:predicted component of type VI protein secretion system